MGRASGLACNRAGIAGVRILQSNERTNDNCISRETAGCKGAEWARRRWEGVCTYKRIKSTYTLKSSRDVAMGWGSLSVL